MRSFALGLLATAIFAAGQVQAQEVVYLTSGSAMAVRSHEVKGDMIHLDLGNDSFIAFPMKMVDRIEGANGVDLSSGNSNVMVPTSERSFPAHGMEVSRTVARPTPASDPHVQVDARMGIVGWVEDPSKGDRSAVSTGRRELMGLPSSDAYRGTTRLGNKYVIQGGPKPTTRATTVGIRMKGAATYPPPPPTQPPQTDTPQPPAEDGGAPPPQDSDSGD